MNSTHQRQTLHRSIVTAGLLAGLFAPGALAQERTDEARALPAPQVPAEVNPQAQLVRHAGEKLAADAIGPGRIVTMDELVAAARELKVDPSKRRSRDGAQGEWVIPKMHRIFYPHSGERYVINKWGDTRMAIGFGESVELDGAWFTGNSDDGAWARGLQVIGYLDGAEVARSEWFKDVDATPSYFAMDMSSVDRIEIHARAAVSGAGWFGMDDLAFERTVDGEATSVVVDFEDLVFGTKLTGSGYAGLTWERGTGTFDEPTYIHKPQVPPGLSERFDPSASDDDDSGASFLVGGGTLPTLVQDFVGPRMDDVGTFTYPPDTCGAVGIDHFVSVVNSNISIYEKATGDRLTNMALTTFFGVGGGMGDPRIAYDHFSDRWIVIATNFNSRLYLAVSETSDPTGAWFTTWFNPSQGSDTNKWPDYPTLGFDEDGIYTSAYMVGGSNRMSIFAIDKAPLIAGMPSLGTVTAFRELTWEGAIQPCATYDSSAEQYFVSVQSTSQIRVRRLDGSLLNPSLVELGAIALSSTGTTASWAPSLGSNVDLDTGGTRLMNAVFRNGSIWTTHTVNHSGRAKVRWYELDPVAMTEEQLGNVRLAGMWFFYPSIAVNSQNDVVLAFSGSNASIYAGAYYTGRLGTDPTGEAADPVVYKAGVNSYNNLDGNGINRWGDYSLTTVDPTDDTKFWTIQEHTRNANRWGTRIAEVEFNSGGCGSMTNYCTSEPNSTGLAALLSGSGSTTIADNNLDLSVTQMPGDKFGYFLMADDQGFVPLFGGSQGNLCLGSPLIRFSADIMQSTPGGTYDFSPDLTNLPQGTVFQPGETWNFQLWFRDNNPSTTSNTSDGLEVQWCL